MDSSLSDYIQNENYFFWAEAMRKKKKKSCQIFLRFGFLFENVVNDLLRWPKSASSGT